MTSAKYQTVKLSKGKHFSPEDGACVMELASMLAGEPFSDHPACVCPVMGSFLRAYNDSLDDTRRQDLYGYAAKVVGSRHSLDAAGAHAVHAIRKHTDATHAEALALIEELRAMGSPAPDALTTTTGLREGSSTPPAVPAS